MATFLETPFLPDASQMRVDHITALLALLLEDPLRFAAISLICKSYSERDASYIWSQCEPHIRLPPSHPLTEANLVKDIILALLQTYTAPKLAATDTLALTDLVSVAFPVEPFILYTAVTLWEEEMVAHTLSHRHPASGWMASLSLTYGVFDAVFALPGHLTGHGVKDPRKSQDPPNNSRLSWNLSSPRLSIVLYLPSVLGDLHARLGPSAVSLRISRSQLGYSFPYALLG